MRIACRTLARLLSANENRIRAAMGRLLRGEIPPGGNWGITTVARGAGVDRTAFYGSRPYTHLRAEFEHRLHQLQELNGESPDPKTAQIERLKADIDKLKVRLDRANSTIEELTDFRTRALARLAAQHDDILRLRAANQTASVACLPATREKTVGSH